MNENEPSRSEELKKVSSTVEEGKKAEAQLGAYERAVQLPEEVSKIQTENEKLESIIENIQSLRMQTEGLLKDLYRDGPGEQVSGQEQLTWQARHHETAEIVINAKQQLTNYSDLLSKLGMYIAAEANIGEKRVVSLEEESNNAKWQPAPAEDGDATPADHTEEPAKE